MASVETLIAFVAATLVFAYMPGPALLYTAAQTIALGRRAGLLAALGIHIGGYFHVVCAAAGLAVLLHAVPTLYAVVKIAGAFYLVWLGVRLILQSPSPVAQQDGKDGLARSRPAIFESIAVEILNPKAALFFVAFLPQFVDASGSLAVWLQFLILGIIVNLMFSSADILCVVIASRITKHLSHGGQMQRWARRLGGGILVGLGIHLGLQKI